MRLGVEGRQVPLLIFTNMRTLISPLYVNHCMRTTISPQYENHNLTSCDQFVGGSSSDMAVDTRGYTILLDTPLLLLLAPFRCLPLSPPVAEGATLAAAAEGVRLEGVSPAAAAGADVDVVAVGWTPDQ